MRRSHSLLLCLTLILTTIMYGCTLKTLVKPEANFTPGEAVDPSHLAKLRFSYHIFDTHNRDAKKALTDSFYSLGVHDAVLSDEILPNRIHLIVYEPSIKNKMIFFWLPWALISGFSFTVVPFYGKVIQPVEIHVIDMDRADNKQFTLISSEITISEFTWLPIALLFNKEMSENHYIPPLKRDETDKIKYVGYHRIFDEVLWNVAKDKLNAN